jgi:hypothetical protein
VARLHSGDPSLYDALYDKISRDDILAHAYAQCRSNKGAPGIDGQDFAEIEAYGSSDGWLNWRLRSGGRLIDQSQSDECIYRRSTANSDRWGSRENPGRSTSGRNIGSQAPLMVMSSKGAV